MPRATLPVLRQIGILAVWSFATFASLALAGIGRSSETVSSIGDVWIGLVVSFLYAGPCFGLVCALFGRHWRAGVRLVLGTWLMTNVLAQAMIAHEDAVLRDEIDCTGVSVSRARAWPYDSSGVVCNDGEWFAHD